MEQLTYAEMVIEQVHAMTLKGGLEWQTDRGYIAANPIPSIRVSFLFTDVGPDSAIWQDIIISHPVRDGMTRLRNPGAHESNPCPLIPSTRTLDQVNEIFRFVLLEPRRQEFQAAMKKLCE